MKNIGFQEDLFTEDRSSHKVYVLILEDILVNTLDENIAPFAIIHDFMYAYSFPVNLTSNLI